MNGETDLAKLIKCMNPEMDATQYIFVCFNQKNVNLESLNYWAMIQEKEGITYIMTTNEAKKKRIQAESIFKKITLNVHSSLEAVGFTAVVATELAHHNISTNVVAGYYHDYIFVPEKKAEEAFERLKQLSGSI